MSSALNYLAITYKVVPEQVDLLVAETWAAGSLGCQIDDGADADRRLLCFFADDGSDPTESMRLPAGVREIMRGPLEDQDWLRAYRETVRPIEVGEGWLIDPGEPSMAAPTTRPSERTLLRLPARRAFGTGGHESTRLALCLLESTPLAGSTVLDLGYGSGVLSFAASSLGARCVAVERDLTAALVGGLNRNLNPVGLPVAMIAGEASSLSDSRQFDGLVVNARPRNWLAEGDQVATRLRQGAVVICSGMLSDEVGDLLWQLASWGWEMEESVCENDWSALRLRVR